MSSHEHGHGGGQEYKVITAARESMQGVTADLFNFLVRAMLGLVPYEESSHGGHH